MKYFILLLTFFISNQIFAATCSSTSRTNYNSGQVLTSTALNADLNQLVSKVNAMDGGCITDGTLEATSLNATDFAALTNGIQQGCEVIYVDSNTVAVDKCMTSVNGKFVKTTTATNVTWGCSGCSAESAGVLTVYYVYAKTGSTGSTLNLLISTTAPNADGYDGSNNKVIGRFQNDASNNIERYAIYSWATLGFTRSSGVNITPGVTSVTTSGLTFGATNAATTPCTTGTCGMVAMGDMISSITWLSSGTYRIQFNKVYTKAVCSGNAKVGAEAQASMDFNVSEGLSTIVFHTYDSSGTITDGYGSLTCMASF